MMKLPIKTDRLIIDKTKLEDIDLLLKIDKQEETQRFLGGIKENNKDERMVLLKKKINNNSLTVFLNNTPIGFVGLNINNNIATLSYIFDYDYTNKGYCTEACSEIIKNTFKELNIDRIVADTIKDNISSIKVLEKLNFKLIKKDNIKLYYELKRK